MPSWKDHQILQWICLQWRLLLFGKHGKNTAGGQNNQRVIREKQQYKVPLGNLKWESQCISICKPLDLLSGNLQLKRFPCFPAKHLGTGRTNLTNLGLFPKISLIQDKCSFSTFWTGKVFFLKSYNQFGYERRRVILFIKLHPRSLWWGVYIFVHCLGEKMEALQIFTP